MPVITDKLPPREDRNNEASKAARDFKDKDKPTAQQLAANPAPVMPKGDLPPKTSREDAEARMKELNQGS